MLSSALLSTLALAAALAQAEPAPPTAPAPSTPAPAAAPAVAAATGERPHLVGLEVGAARRLSPAGGEVPPRHGLAVGMKLGRRYLRLGELVDLGAAFHFSFHRYAKDVTISAPGRQPVEDLRTLTFYDLTVLQTAALDLGRLRPFLALGGGLSLGHFSTIEPEYDPGEARATRPLLLGSAGVEVVVHEETSVALEVAGSYLVAPPGFSGTDGRERRVFGNRVAASVGLRHAF